MSSVMSFHNDKDRRLLEVQLREANENMRQNAKLDGHMTSTAAFGAVAADEVLNYMQNAVMQRAAAVAAAAPPKPKRPPTVKSGSASRAKAPKRKAGPGRKARGRG